MIINPIWFYLIQVSNSFKIASGVGAAILGVVAFFIFAASQETYYEETEEKYIKVCKLCIKVAVILLVLAVVLPSQETCYQMLIASQVTTENINTLIDTVKNCVDYIVNALK